MWPWFSHPQCMALLFYAPEMDARKWVLLIPFRKWEASGRVMISPSSIGLCQAVPFVKLFSRELSRLECMLYAVQLPKAKCNAANSWKAGCVDWPWPWLAHSVTSPELVTSHHVEVSSMARAPSPPALVTTWGPAGPQRGQLDGGPSSGLMRELRGQVWQDSGVEGAGRRAAPEESSLGGLRGWPDPDQTLLSSEQWNGMEHGDNISCTFTIIYYYFVCVCG